MHKVCDLFANVPNIRSTDESSSNLRQPQRQMVVSSIRVRHEPEKARSHLCALSLEVRLIGE